MAKYAKAASKRVKSAMHRKQKGTLQSGSGRKVKSRKQAIARALSEAREKGGERASAQVERTKKAIASQDLHLCRQITSEQTSVVTITGHVAKAERLDVNDSRARLAVPAGFDVSAFATGLGKPGVGRRHRPCHRIHALGECPGGPRDITDPRNTPIRHEGLYFGQRKERPIMRSRRRAVRHRRSSPEVDRARIVRR